MRVLVQRVASARVEVEGQVSGAIAGGLLLLVGIEEADGEADIVWLSAKLIKLRIFPDAAGVMNRSLIETGGEVLASVNSRSLHRSGKAIGQRGVALPVPRFRGRCSIGLSCSLNTISDARWRPVFSAPTCGSI